jgi:hypothetical protein
MRFPAVLLWCVLCLSDATTAVAQQANPPTPQDPNTAGSRLLDRLNSRQAKYECNVDYCILIGQVELPLDAKTTLFADQVELFLDTNRVIAQGNVVFAMAEGRLSAERMEYDVATGTGTFQTANGLMSLGAQADRRQFGNQEAEVYFYGDTIERLGPRKYRITRGAFTTCVQPTPRWQVTSGSITLNLNDYAVAKSTVLHVKGVPVLYLPMIYYPIREDERATGFLLPTYGTSTLRGQAISNAFFWAINRSTDATFFHDWFTNTGQGAGVEYRYVAAAQSTGDIRFYRFAQKEATFTNDGQTQTLPQSTSYEIVGRPGHAAAVSPESVFGLAQPAGHRGRSHRRAWKRDDERPVSEERDLQLGDELAGVRQHPTSDHDPVPAAPLQRADLCVSERRVRVPARSHDLGWDRGERHRLHATRRHADRACADVAVDVPVGEHQRRVPDDALLAQQHGDVTGRDR